MEGVDWSAILAILAGLAGAVIGGLFMVGKNKADAKRSDQEGEATLSKVTIEWAKELRSSLETQIHNLNADYERKFTAMSLRIAALEAHNAMLMDQLEAAGLNPVPLPRRDD